MTVVLAPLVSVVLTEIAKWLGETVGPEWPALATKLVNFVINWLLLNQGIVHLPASMVPQVQLLAVPLAAVLSTVGAQFIHDVATWTSKQAGITVPTARLGIKLGTQTKQGG